MTMVPSFDKPARRLWMCVVLLLALLFTGSLGAQTASQSAPAQKPPAENQKPHPSEEPQTKITPEEAQELFRSVDEILNFASKDTKLPIKNPVKRALAARDQVR